MTEITDIGGSSTLQSLTYGYYPTNNVQTITNAVASSQNAGSANMSYGYGTGSDLLATLSVGGTVVQTIGYTADGRIAILNPGIQAPTGQYITSLSYNQDGRLASVNAGGGALASYIYDGFEQRLIKTVSGSYGEIYQYGQDGALLEETNASGVAQADYVYLNGRPVAVLNGSTLYYLHGDMLGTPQLATDNNQAVQWQASYDAFGQASVSGTVTQNLRLPGQYFDVESGWNHNGFRDYAPALGRYIEPDPLGRLGSGNNLYVYVGNNPTNSTDPLGLCGIPVQRKFSRKFKCSRSASDVMNALENNFASFADNPEQGNFSTYSIFTPGPVSPGQQIGIDVGVEMFGDTVGYNDVSVTVQSATSSELVFQSDPGHVLYPATVAFNASDAGNGSITFTTSVDATTNGLTGTAEFYLFGGRAGETSTWNNLLNNVASFCAQPIP